MHAESTKLEVASEHAPLKLVTVQGKIQWGRTLRTAKYKVERMRLCLEAAQDERDEVSCGACPCATSTLSNTSFAIKLCQTRYCIRVLAWGCEAVWALAQCLLLDFPS